MRHTMNINSNTYRIEWPFYKMEVGDFVMIRGPKAKEVKTRAVAAAYHYREAYDKWFRAIKVSDNEFKIVRYQ